MKINNVSIPVEHYNYNTIAELAALIPGIWKEIKDYNVLLLSGNLGSGKTTFVQLLGKHIHLVDSVSSPTFALINEYLDQDNNRYYHMDMYRLESIEEAVDLGLEEIIYSGAYCFIEWPELIFDILPPKFVHLKFTQNTNKRVLEIEKNG